VEVIYKYYPRAIDNLGLDRGLFEGPKPKLLLVDDIAELTVANLLSLFKIINLVIFTYFFGTYLGDASRAAAVNYREN
jgi:hypothetical protein